MENSSDVSDDGDDQERLMKLSETIKKNVSRSLKVINRPKDAYRLSLYINKMSRVLNRAVRMTRTGCVDDIKENIDTLRKQIEVLEDKRKEQREDVTWVETESSYKKRIRTGLIVNRGCKDAKVFLENAYYIIADQITKGLKRDLLKVSTVLEVRFVLPDTKRVRSKRYTSRAVRVQTGDDLKQWYADNVMDELLSSLYESDGDERSGWTLYEVRSLKIVLYVYNPIMGRSYIPLPKEIVHKRAVVNVQNRDDYCFLWAVMSALYPPSCGAYRVSSYPHFNKHLKYEGFTFPMPVDDIPRFEALNELSINVYGLRVNNEVVPLRISNYNFDKKISLLFFKEQYVDEEEYNYHYAWIKNLSRLLAAQISLNINRKEMCFRCLNYFLTKQALDKHENVCNNLTRFVLPSEDEKVVKFKNFHKKERLPFVIYVTFGCVTERCEETPFVVGIYFKCGFNKSLSFCRMHQGEDCEQWLVNKLKRIVNIIQNNKNAKIKELTTEQSELFEQATVCHICEEPFKENEQKVRDLCHFTGNYRGAAHRVCDLNYRNGKVVPIVYHNFSESGRNFLIDLVSSSFKGNSRFETNHASYIKYITNTRVALRLLDSHNFMYGPFEELYSDLNDRKKEITRSYYDDIQSIQQMTFPHGRIDSYSLLDDETSFDHLNLNVPEGFNIRNLGEYSNLYFKSRLLLLVDVFENIRQVFFDIYQLDALRYYSLPHLVYEAMLKVTKIELELLTDTEKILFIENGTRGGLSQVSTRHVRANNKYIKSYDPVKDDSTLMFFDINQLEAVMSKKLPYKDLEWVENFDVTELDELDENSDVGYIFEVDLDYPVELHRPHNDLPLCPEQTKPSGSNYSKLIASLNPKKNYILHYLNLKQSLDLGLKLERIHRTLRFKQTDWLSPFIQLHNSFKSTTIEFSRRFYQSLNHIIYETLTDDFRKYQNRNLVHTWNPERGQSAKKYVSKPNFHSGTIIHHNTTIFNTNPASIKLDKPIYTRFVLHDLVKHQSYTFHYNLIKNNFGDNAKLVYTDTNAFIYNFVNIDPYEIIKNNPDMFDTSDYPIINRYGISESNDNSGLITDRLHGRILYEFIGFRSNMYSLRIEKDDAEKSDDTVITFNDYIECFKNNISNLDEEVYQCNNITVYTVKDNETAGLVLDDDKRGVCADNINTYAWGYEN